MMKPRRRLLLCVVGVVFVVIAVTGSAAEWPQFHGPRRDNISGETGLLKQWPEGGPKLLWTAKGIGHGFSTVAIAGGFIYTAGNVGRDTVITALDLDGKPRWTAKNGRACKHDRPGTRSTPTLDGDRLYHENCDGDVVCLNAETGKLLWRGRRKGRAQWLEALLRRCSCSSRSSARRSCSRAQIGPCRR